MACGIAGVATRGQKLNLELLWRIMHRTTIRGRDSWGYKAYGDVQSGRTFGHVGVCEFNAGLIADEHENPPPIHLNGSAIANLRAEPTTEYVAKKRLCDIQPFTVGPWTIAHNGTIANDKVICAEQFFNPETPIDSWVIAALLNKFCHDEVHGACINNVLKDRLVGSYALAVTHKENPGFLHLMCNYKPIYYGSVNNQEGPLVFSSVPEAFEGENVISIQELPPYSSLTIQPDNRRIFRASLRPEKVGKTKALVVCSGGLDSTVVASYAREKGYNTTLLHFRYGCRAEAREEFHVKQIAERLNCRFMVVPLDMFTKVIGGSPLTGTADETIADGEAGAEFAHEWVPARNLIMLAIATGVAESHGYDKILLGTNLEESGAYPDNEPEFIRKFKAILPYSVAADKHVEIEQPVGHLMKHEIVRMGLELDSPLGLTWSCYEGGKVHCGNCGPCFMRKKAFDINGELDPVRYEGDKKF